MTATRNDAPQVRLSQRLPWLAVVVASVAVLGVAAGIDPDLRGYGSHTQLGLPPCGFLLLTGAPCPGCGLTTAFAHGIRGQWAMAASANPLGLALFIIVCACIPLGVTAALRGWSLGEVVDRFGLNRWALTVAACAVAVWVVRFAVAI
ncbi:MAG: DUF2752 domain-containing protein [Deltaproteobacteria bacterium]|nr:DUF2752 domain-containing protein [Deltaproteobacteria bacterium]